MTGAVYWAPGLVRKGNIGCAKLYIDGQPVKVDVIKDNLTGSAKTRR